MRTSRSNDATRFFAAICLVGSIGSLATGCVAQPSAAVVQPVGPAVTETVRPTLAPRVDPAVAELTDLINAWRRGGADCDGKRLAPAVALMANPALASTAVAGSQRPIEALKQRGYLAAQAETVFVTGPSRANEVMRVLAQKYCKVLGSNELTDIGIGIGIERDGRTWHLVLARPLLAGDLGDWRKAGLDVLHHANVARGVTRICGNRRFAAAPPLAWNDTLAAAALAHSEDMARRDELSHAGSDRSNSGDRATRAGYQWQLVGENIASGQGSARLVVDSWLASPEHCATLMESRFSEMGAAYVMKPNSRGTIYWAQEFGVPRQR